MERINRIKEVLVIQGKTQKWLAEQMGKSTTAIAAICNNKAQPHLKDLKKIAKLLDVDIRELLVSTKWLFVVFLYKGWTNYQPLNKAVRTLIRTPYDRECFTTKILVNISLLLDQK